MNILRVGDPHVKPSNVEESSHLMRFVANLALERKVDRIEILGDLFHTHAVLRLEVIRFWDEWIHALTEGTETVFLEGNHDQSGDYSANYSALNIYSRANKPKLILATQPTIIGPYAYMPYFHDKDKFIQFANATANQGCRVLVCHQTFQGSKYDNGMYAPDGIDPDALSPNFIHIISGHVHAEQEYGRVIYPGTARWDTASDANKRKGVWIYRHDDVTGQIIDREFISTEEVCRPIHQFEWVEGQEKPVIPRGSRATIELIGSSEWINQQKPEFRGIAAVKTKYTDANRRTENRASGIDFMDFMQNHFVSTMDRGHLVKLMKEWNLD